MRQLRNHGLMGLVLALGPLAAGCDAGSIAVPCQTVQDCPAGQTCTAEGYCAGGGDGGLGYGDGGGGRCGSKVVCGGRCCATGQRCSAGRCVAAPRCNKHEDCSDDSYCYKGYCLGWGSGPLGDRNKSCTTTSAAGLFSPARQCAWTAPPAGDKYPNHRNVLGTPMVVDFDFDGDPKKRRPSIVFVSYDGTDGGSAASQCAGGKYGVIRVIDGATCKQQHTVDAARVRASSPLALADLDGDKRAEIIALRCGGGLVALRYDAKAKRFKLAWTSSPSTTGGSAGGWSGPSVHDLDGDGKPEILAWGTVWDRKGKLIDGSLGQLAYSAGYIPVASDIDGDGKVELTNGAKIWQWSGSKWVVEKSTTQKAGHVAVADFGTFGASKAGDDRSKLDGKAEIAVVSSGTVRVQTLAGRVVFGPVKIPRGGTGGPPTIGDFDKDGRAELAAAGSDSYTVFDPDCKSGASKKVCPTQKSGGVLWSKLSQDHSSSVTGSSVFDFEGDGAAEAVYADECFTRVYSGSTGEVVYSQYRSSCTWYENPIVADVDGDFNAELVVPSNNNCNTDCTTNKNHDKHPKTGVTLDPLFRGLRCKKTSDCPSGGTCSSGYCRCTTDAHCGGGGFVCGPAKSGTPGSGKVCRAAYKGKLRGVIVYRDVLDRWVSSRMIWNQHAYAVTNVSDSGNVPSTASWKANWKQKRLNNFRQNVQGDLDPKSTPDLTAKRTGSLRCASGSLTLTVKLCNRGTQPVGAGLPVTFYEGAPKLGKKICTAKSKGQLDPGKCTPVSCSWTSPPKQKVDVHAVADDDGKGKSTTRECVEGNNATVLKGVRCNDIG